MWFGIHTDSSSSHAANSAGWTIMPLSRWAGHPCSAPKGSGGDKREDKEEESGQQESMKKAKMNGMNGEKMKSRKRQIMKRKQEDEEMKECKSLFLFLSLSLSF